jgi:hypothetical protein
MVTLFANNIDHTKSIDWLNNIVVHYRNIRNNNKNPTEFVAFKV